MTENHRKSSCKMTENTVDVMHADATKNDENDILHKDRHSTQNHKQFKMSSNGQQDFRPASAAEQVASSVAQPASSSEQDFFDPISRAFSHRFTHKGFDLSSMDVGCVVFYDCTLNRDYGKWKRGDKIPQITVEMKMHFGEEDGTALFETQEFS